MLRKRAWVPLTILLCLTVATTASAGVMTYVDRATFETHGPIAQNNGFEGYSSNDFAFPGDPWTAGGVTYTGDNLIVGPGSFWTPVSHVFASNAWSPIAAQIDPEPQYTMFGLDLGYVGFFSSPITFTAFTNLGSHSFPDRTVPNANTSLDFYGFVASDGEYFTGFTVESEAGFGTAPVIDNVTLGGPQVPEPATLLLLGAGLLGLGGASRRRRR